MKQKRKRMPRRGPNGLLVALLVGVLLLIAGAACVFTPFTVMQGEDSGSAQEQQQGPSVSVDGVPQMVVYLRVLPDGTPGAIGPIGCDSYLDPYPVGVYQPTHVAPQIAYALTALFELEGTYIGPDEALYNPFSLSDLVVNSVAMDGDGNVSVELSGELVLSGVCSDAVIQPIIAATVAQFGVQLNELTINGQPLSAYLVG